MSFWDTSPEEPTPHQPQPHQPFVGKGDNDMIVLFAEVIAGLLEDMTGDNGRVAAMAVVHLEAHPDTNEVQAGCQVVGFTPDAIRYLGQLGATALFKNTEAQYQALRDLYDDDDDDEDEDE